MVGTYEIRLGSSPVGCVTVERQGLYYRFSCRCELREKGMYRLAASCDGKREDLGTLIPMEGAFGLEKRIPVKRLGEGKPEFFLMSKENAKREKFVPVYPEEPFSYMARLKDAYLARREGQSGLMIRE